MKNGIEAKFRPVVHNNINISSMVGMAIASIYNLGAHIYLGASCLSKYGASGCI